jgi:hypothetical protein
MALRNGSDKGLRGMIARSCAALIVLAIVACAPPENVVPVGRVVVNVDYVRDQMRLVELPEAAREARYRELQRQIASIPLRVKRAEYLVAIDELYIVNNLLFTMSGFPREEGRFVDSDPDAAWVMKAYEKQDFSIRFNKYLREPLKESRATRRRLPPCTNGINTFYVTDDDTLHCVFNQTGDERYSRDLKDWTPSSPPVCNGGYVFVGEQERNRFKALSHDNAIQEWVDQNLFDTVQARPYADDNNVYFLAGDGRICCNAVEGQGQRKWEERIGSFPRADLYYKNDTLLVGGTDGTLFAFSRAGETKWKYHSGAPITTDYSKEPISAWRKPGTDDPGLIEEWIYLFTNERFVALRKKYMVADEENGAATRYIERVEEAWSHNYKEAFPLTLGTAANSSAAAAAEGVMANDDIPFRVDKFLLRAANRVYLHGTVTVGTSASDSRRAHVIWMLDAYRGDVVGVYMLGEDANSDDGVEGFELFLTNDDEADPVLYLATRDGFLFALGE